METEDNETLLTYLTSTIKNSKQPQDFFDINGFSFPKQADLKERCKNNFNNFLGNYLIVLCIFVFVFLILNPVALPLIIVWGLYVFFVNKGEQDISVSGYTIKKEWVLKGMVAFSILFILCVYWVFVSLLATTSLFALVVVAHMCFRTEIKEEVEL